ncbi:hypothetical protein LT493_11860 [Streptomyces tricolor]|nr:hypothetical protein [Streptomyces tricolor]
MRLGEDDVGLPFLGDVEEAGQDTRREPAEAAAGLLQHPGLLAREGDGVSLPVVGHDLAHVIGP